MNTVSNTFSCTLPCFPECSSIELDNLCVSTSKVALGAFTGIAIAKATDQIGE